MLSLCISKFSVFTFVLLNRSYCSHWTPNEIYCGFYLVEFHLLVLRTCVCLHYAQLPHFINKKRKTDRSFYMPRKQKCIIFTTRRLARDKLKLMSILKRTYPSTFFKHFAKIVWNTKNRLLIYNSILVQIHNQTCNYLCVVFLETLEHH